MARYPDQPPSHARLLGVGLLVGFLLNLTGWLGNNFLLGSSWASVGSSTTLTPWAASLWSDAFSMVPDYVYGVAIVWVYSLLRRNSVGATSAALQSGIFVSILGGIVTYFAIANSGFIPWTLAVSSFALVLATKLPLAFLGARLLDGNKTPSSGSST